MVTHAILLGSTYADAKTTTTFLRSPVGCHEESMFFGRRPRDGRVYGTLMGAAVGLTVVDYFVERGLVRRGHRRLAKWWRVVPLSYAVGHSVYAINNRTCF